MYGVTINQRTQRSIVASYSRFTRQLTPGLRAVRTATPTPHGGACAKRVYWDGSSRPAAGVITSIQRLNIATNPTSTLTAHRQIVSCLLAQNYVVHRSSSRTLSRIL